MSLSYEVTADFLVFSQDLSRKYMRCSSRVTVYHLKRFLLQKLCIPALYDVSPNQLDESHSLNLHTLGQAVSLFPGSPSLAGIAWE